jgi:hypothetical protein
MTITQIVNLVPQIAPELKIIVLGSSLVVAPTQKSKSVSTSKVARELPLSSMTGTNYLISNAKSKPFAKSKSSLASITPIL